jgi:hypothetical protein
MKTIGHVLSNQFFLNLNSERKRSIYLKKKEYQLVKLYDNFFRRRSTRTHMLRRTIKKRSVTKIK